MLYRENGQFKTTYATDQQIFPIAQDRYGILALVAFVAFCASIRLGAFPMTFGEVLQALVGTGDSTTHFIVMELRMPRALVGLLVGAALGALAPPVGCAMAPSDGRSISSGSMPGFDVAAALRLGAGLALDDAFPDGAAVAFGFATDGA